MPEAASPRIGGLMDPPGWAGSRMGRLAGDPERRAQARFGLRKISNENSHRRWRSRGAVFRQSDEEGVAADTDHGFRAQPAGGYLRFRSSILGRDAGYLRDV